MQLESEVLVLERQVAVKNRSCLRAPQGRRTSKLWCMWRALWQQVWMRQRLLPEPMPVMLALEYVQRRSAGWADTLLRVLRLQVPRGVLPRLQRVSNRATVPKGHPDKIVFRADHRSNTRARKLPFSQLLCNR